MGMQPWMQAWPDEIKGKKFRIILDPRLVHMGEKREEHVKVRQSVLVRYPSVAWEGE